MAIGAAIGGAALGAIAGGMQDKSGGSQVSGIRVAPETQLEQFAGKDLLERLKQLGSIVDQGPGAQDQTQALTDVRSLADMLRGFSTGGANPTQADITQSNTLFDALYSPAFRQQEQQAARLAAQLGRPVNDPIIQARLRSEQANQRGAFVAQQSFNAPRERLGFAQQLANVSGGLASQALANRQMLLSQGSQLREQDRQYRINTGERYGSFEQYSGGGLKGALTGAIGGAGAGLQAASMFSQMGGMAAGAGAGAGALDVAGGNTSFSSDYLGQSGNYGTTFDSTGGMSDWQLAQSLNRQNQSFVRPAAAPAPQRASRITAPRAPASFPPANGGYSGSFGAPAPFDVSNLGRIYGY